MAFVSFQGATGPPGSAYYGGGPATAFSLPGSQQFYGGGTGTYGAAPAALPARPAPSQIASLGAGGSTRQANPGTLGPGSPHPYTAANLGAGIDEGGLYGPPGLPNNQFIDRFLPPILSDPFIGSSNAAAQIGSYAAQAVPQAAAFQQGLYTPGLNAMEQAFMGSGAQLGLRGLESSFNRIDSQYENTPMHSSRFREMNDAGNQFATTLMNLASQAAVQRQQMATQNLPVAFGTPLQAGQAQQQAAAGLHNLSQQAITGELNFPLAAYSGFPVVSPAIVQSGGSSGGKK